MPRAVRPAVIAAPASVVMSGHPSPTGDSADHHGVRVVLEHQSSCARRGRRRWDGAGAAIDVSANMRLVKSFSAPRYPPGELWTVRCWPAPRATAERDPGAGPSPGAGRAPIARP